VNQLRSASVGRSHSRCDKTSLQMKPNIRGA